MKKINNATGWNKISKSYQKRYSISTDKYYWGPLCSSEYDSLLGNFKNKKILEVGSGAGQNSIFLAKKGARVTALDFSQEQIKHGKHLAEIEKIKIEYIQGDFEKLNNYFKINSFDIVVSAFALQYCQTIKSLNSVMKQIFDISKPGGLLVFSVDHPVRDHGYWNKKDQFILDNYFDRNRKTWSYDFPEDEISATMSGSFKTISDYLMAVIKAGFILNNFIETEPIAHESTNNFATKSRYLSMPTKNPFSYDHLKKIPGTIIIKATKT